MNPPRILIADPDPCQARVLTRVLRQRGFEAVSVRDPVAALAEASARPPAAVIIEQRFGDVSGLACIRPLRDACPETRILVLTSFATVEKAVDAVKLGAWNYMAKPAYADEIVAGLGLEMPTAVAGPQPQARERTYSLDDFEWSHILRALNDNGGNVSAAARALKMHRRTLQRKLEIREEKSGRHIVAEIRINAHRRVREEHYRRYCRPGSPAANTL